MLKAFQEYIVNSIGLSSNDSTLLAVSGGMDSMVLLHLFHAANLNCGVAHCNFQLRGEASDADAILVEKMAKTLNLPFYSIRFDTQSIAEKDGISIQMAARNLRYQWLEAIREEKEYDYLATAHHLNDSIETLIYNIAKGCGIKGLHGIPIINGTIIRPLSFASRSAIEDYQQSNNIFFREDVSNSSTKYSRNLIRLKLIPILKKINPALEQTMSDNLQRFQEAEYLYALAVKGIKEEAISRSEHRVEVDTQILQQHELALSTLLYECLKEFGINTAQAHQLAKAIKEEHVGANFFTGSHHLILDRSKILIEQKTDKNQTTIYTIDTKTESQLELPDGYFSISFIEGQPDAYSNDPFLAFLDAEELILPLQIRHWQPGDTFQPLGMNGHHQKLQDFFSNNKLSLLDKNKVWIVEDAQGRICWLTGYRLDDRFKIKQSTKSYWALNFVKL